VLYGLLTDKNKPAQTGGSAENMNFQSLGKDPSVKVNVGFKNSFQVLRLELVHRLT
jgi:hypothetical protein